MWGVMRVRAHFPWGSRWNSLSTTWSVLDLQSRPVPADAPGIEQRWAHHLLHAPNRLPARARTFSREATSCSSQAASCTSGASPNRRGIILQDTSHKP